MNGQSVQEKQIKHLQGKGDNSDEHGRTYDHISCARVGRGSDAKINKAEEYEAEEYEEEDKEEDEEEEEEDEL